MNKDPDQQFLADTAEAKAVFEQIRSHAETKKNAMLQKIYDAYRDRITHLHGRLQLTLNGRDRADIEHELQTVIDMRAIEVRNADRAYQQEITPARHALDEVWRKAQATRWEARNKVKPKT